jgi:hypothetical protein
MMLNLTQRGTQGCEMGTCYPSLRFPQSAFHERKVQFSTILNKEARQTMRHFVTATAVVAFLATGLADAQMKSAVPPGTKPSTPRVTAAVATPVPEAPLESARRIPREEAIKLVKEKKAVYVDVRSKDQYDQAHIVGAISIPLGEIITRARELPPGKFIITYCA